MFSDELDDEWECDADAAPSRAEPSRVEPAAKENGRETQTKPIDSLSHSLSVAARDSLKEGLPTNRKIRKRR